MRSLLRTTLVGVAVMSALIGAPPCLASDTDAAPDSTLGTPLTAESLAENRGGQAIQMNLNDLDAKLYDNQAIANITGSNYVTTGALAGATGFPTVVQNSGNNVIIQNATIINLQVQ